MEFVLQANRFAQRPSTDTAGRLRSARFEGFVSLAESPTVPLHDQLHEIERAGETPSAVPEREQAQRWEQQQKR